MYDPNATSADQNFLFGLLALQADLVTRDHFLQACHEWAEQTELSLSRLLVQRGWLKPEDRREVERLVERKLARHGGDVRACLSELADNPLQKVFVTLRAGELGAIVPVSLGNQSTETPRDGVSGKSRRHDWGDSERHSEYAGSDNHNENMDSWAEPSDERPRPRRTLLGSAAVLVAVVLAAVVVGVVLMPLIQQVQ